jgi:hypothetical protein
MTTPNQPGWYDDPNDSNAQRYWDGQDWTPHRQRKPTSRPARPSAMPTPPPNLPPPPPPNLPPPPAAAPTQPAPGSTLPPPPDYNAAGAGQASGIPTQAAAQARLAPSPDIGAVFGHAPQQSPGNAYVYKNPILYAVGGLFFPPLVLFLMGGSRTTCAWMIGLWVLFWLTIWAFFIGGIFIVPLYIWSVVACYQEAVEQNKAHGLA